MDAMKKAKPTEYKGVCYRSKSEAMFARWMELRAEDAASYYSFGRPGFSGVWGDMQSGFSYEPGGAFDVDGWRPDFLFWSVQYETHCGGYTPLIYYRLLEYKPAMPTDTYLDAFARRYVRICEQLRGGGDRGLLPNLFYPKVYFGSVFNESRGVLSLNGDFGWDLSSEDWLYPFEDDVKATRFDLVAGGAA